MLLAMLLETIEEAGQFYWQTRWVQSTNCLNEASIGMQDPAPSIGKVVRCRKSQYISFCCYAFWKYSPALVSSPNSTHREKVGFCKETEECGYGSCCWQQAIKRSAFAEREKLLRMIAQLKKLCERKSSFSPLMPLPSQWSCFIGVKCVEYILQNGRGSGALSTPNGILTFCAIHTIWFHIKTFIPLKKCTFTVIINWKKWK